MMTAGDIIACARRYVGVRFAHQGRTAQGLDCLGLLLIVAADAGLRFDGSVPLEMDVPNYGRRPDTQLLQARLAMHLTPVDEAQEADVLLLRVDGSPQHLAMVCDYPMAGELGMIHAYAPSRQVVEHRYDAQWRAATHAMYRLPVLH